MFTKRREEKTQIDENTIINMKLMQLLVKIGRSIDVCKMKSGIWMSKNCMLLEQNEIYDYTTYNCRNEYK